MKTPKDMERARRQREALMSEMGRLLVNSKRLLVESREDVRRVLRKLAEFQR